MSMNLIREMIGPYSALRNVFGHSYGAARRSLDSAKEIKCSYRSGDHAGKCILSVHQSCENKERHERHDQGSKRDIACIGVHVDWARSVCSLA